MRFRQAHDTQAVEAFIAEKQIDLTQEVSEFRLVRTEREPMLEFEVLKRYGLQAVEP